MASIHGVKGGGPHRSSIKRLSVQSSRLCACVRACVLTKPLVFR